MSNRDYDEMSASEVVADLHGPGYQDSDTGEVWDGNEFQDPGEVVDTDVNAVALAKDEARKKYLKVFRNRVETCERNVAVAQEALRDAQNDLERAEVNADRWYG